MSTINIIVPASTANVGPGFDALGAALTLHLSVSVTYASEIPYLSRTVGTGSNISLTYNGDSPEVISVEASKNFIVRVASIVAAINGKILPNCSIVVDNPIPLGRGLGSSGSAIVAGVILADLLCDLHLTRAKLLDYAVFFEGHPDNVSPSLLGGFCASYLSTDIKSLTSFVDSLPSFVPNEIGNKVDSNLKISSIIDLNNDDIAVDQNIILKMKDIKDTRNKYLEILRDINVNEDIIITKSFSIRNIAESIRAVAVIPEFKVPTSEARKVLPQRYTREDIIFNIQRVAVLVALLTSQHEGLGLADYLLEPLQIQSVNSLKSTIISQNKEEIISENITNAEGVINDPQSQIRRLFQADYFKGSIDDKIHQDYRKVLVPGLSEILNLNKRILSYTTLEQQNKADLIDGLLGIFMSGAGPTILALTYNNHEHIGKIIQDIWINSKDKDNNAIVSDYKILKIDLNGALLTI